MNYKTRILCTRCVSHRISIISRMETRVKPDGEADKNSNRVVRNQEERKGYTKRKCLKQYLSSAEDLTVMVPDVHDFPTIDSIKIFILSYRLLYDP